MAQFYGRAATAGLGSSTNFLGLLFITAVALMLVTMFASDLGVLLFALLSSGALILLSFKALPRTLAKVNVYLFLVELLYIQVRVMVSSRRREGR